MRLVQETIPADEPDIIDELIQRNLKTVWTDRGTRKRGQHGKHHGLLQGTFEVLPDLPTDLAQGLFQPGKAYDCEVRFSNGGRVNDADKDVRGMAIKLHDVSGSKLHPVLAAGWGLLMLAVFHTRILLAAWRFAGRHVSNPLSLTYHSTTPYLLGADKAVKYKAIGQAPAPKPSKHEHALARAMWHSIGEAEATFDFGVVVQTDPAMHPIEDASIDWETNGARFVKLAKITLPKQATSPESQERAETMRFSPWMCLAQHRPLGTINRARLAIYQAISDLRARKSD